MRPRTYREFLLITGKEDTTRSSDEYEDYLDAFEDYLDDEEDEEE